MAYFLADSTGPLEDFASIGGLADFRRWAAQYLGPLAQLARRGFTEDLEGLAVSLVHVAGQPPEAVQEQRDLLLKYAKSAQDVLIVTDGTSGEDVLRSAKRHSESEIHIAADRHYAQVMLAVSYAFMKGRKAVNKGLLATATTDAQLMSAMDDAPQAVRVALLEVLPRVLLACLKAGGEVGLVKLPRLRTNLRALKPFNIRFDATSPEAVEWARNHAGELAKGLSATSAQDIREAIVSALEGEGLEHAYEEILSAVGSSDRAEMIARTEVMTAANEGLAQSWDQAIKSGLLTGKENKVWIATAGCCDGCDELDGEEVPLNDDFSIGDDPPAHPSCRCTMGLGDGVEE